MNQLIETMFANRGYDINYINSINDYQHKKLYNVVELANKLKRIHDTGAHIVVLPDFDTDGIMSGVVGFAGLAELGFRVSLFIPNPSEGYGFTDRTIERLVSEYPDVKAIITCDVGISCYDGIDKAKAMDIEVLVTDHHNELMDFSERMNADIVVDPMQKKDTYEHPSICGAYVLYQCLLHYAETYGSKFEYSQMRRLRVFAGIGTISDLMPMLYENRGVVKDALSLSRLIYSDANPWFINSITGCDTYRRVFFGLYTVLDVFAQMGKIKTIDNIDESFFGYYFAPMFNSIKRLDGDMRDAFDVFFGGSQVASVTKLYDMNENRKQLVSECLQNTLAADQPYAPFVYISSAQHGILGLLAAKLQNMDNMPKIVVIRHSDGSYGGSGRSPFWYPFFTRMQAQGFDVAGHENAFGINFADINELQRFFEFITVDAVQVRAKAESEGMFAEVVPDFVIATDGTGDTNIDIPLFAEYLQEIKFFAPFGPMFDNARIKLRFKAGDGTWSAIGSAKQHLKIVLNTGFYILCWNEAQFLSRGDKKDDIIEVMGHLDMNVYRNTITIGFIADTFAV